MSGKWKKAEVPEAEETQDKIDRLALLKAQLTLPQRATELSKDPKLLIVQGLDPRAVERVRAKSAKAQKEFAGETSDLMRERTDLIPIAAMERDAEKARNQLEAQLRTPKKFGQAAPSEDAVVFAAIHITAIVSHSRTEASAEVHGDMIAEGNKEGQKVAGKEVVRNAESEAEATGVSLPEVLNSAATVTLNTVSAKRKISEQEAANQYGADIVGDYKNAGVAASDLYKLATYLDQTYKTDLAFQYRPTISKATRDQAMRIAQLSPESQILSIFREIESTRKKQDEEREEARKV